MEGLELGGYHACKWAILTVFIAHLVTLSSFFDCVKQSLDGSVSVVRLALNQGDRMDFDKAQRSMGITAVIVTVLSVGVPVAFLVWLVTTLLEAYPA